MSEEKGDLICSDVGFAPAVCTILMELTLFLSVHSQSNYFGASFNQITSSPSSSRVIKESGFDRRFTFSIAMEMVSLARTSFSGS